MSRDHEVTNESAHCWEKFSSYITIGPFIREKSRGLHKTRKEPFCEYGLHKTRTARINASRIYSSRPDRSNDVLACLLPAVTSSEHDMTLVFLYIWLYIWRYDFGLFRFKLTYRLILVLDCCEPCAETSTKISSAINRVVLKRWYGDGWGRVWTKFPALSCSSWSLGRLSNNHGDGYENVNVRAYSRQMFGNFSWSLILKNNTKFQKKKKKIVVLCSRPPQNIKLGIFTS